MKIGGAAAVYHCMTRTVNGEMLFEDREKEMLEMVARGLDNAHIGAKLSLADQTVRNYLSRIYTKLGVGSRAEAIVWARERGMGRG